MVFSCPLPSFLVPFPLFFLYLPLSLFFPHTLSLLCSVCIVHVVSCVCPVLRTVCLLFNSDGDTGREEVTSVYVPSLAFCLYLLHAFPCSLSHFVCFSSLRLSLRLDVTLNSLLHAILLFTLFSRFPSVYSIRCCAFLSIYLFPVHLCSPVSLYVCVCASVCVYACILSLYFWSGGHGELLLSRSS